MYDIIFKYVWFNNFTHYKTNHNIFFCPFILFFVPIHIFLQNKKSSPKKSKRIIKSKIFYSNRVHKQTLFVKQVGGDGELIISYLESGESGTGGYMNPIHKHLLSKATSMPPAPEKYGPSFFDICYGDYLYLRSDHESNNKVSMGYKSKNGKEYDRTLSISMPNGEKYGDNEGNVDRSCVQRTRNYFISVLLEDDKDKKDGVHFTSWKESDNLTQTPFEPLDKVMTDESVDQVLTNYYLPVVHKRQEVYNFLLQSDITGIYSRRVSDGRYSKYAVLEFGFPDDVVKTEIPSMVLMDGETSTVTDTDSLLII